MSKSSDQLLSRYYEDAKLSNEIKRLLSSTYLSVADIAECLETDKAFVRFIARVHSRPKLYKYMTFIDTVLTFKEYGKAYRLFEQGVPVYTVSYLTGASTFVASAIRRAFLIDTKQDVMVDNRIADGDIDKYLSLGITIAKIAKEHAVGYIIAKLAVFSYLYKNNRAYKKCVLHPRETYLDSCLLREIQRLEKNGFARVVIASKLNINLRTVFRALEGDDYLERFKSCK